MVTQDTGTMSGRNHSRLAATLADHRVSLNNPGYFPLSNHRAFQSLGNNNSFRVNQSRAQLLSPMRKSNSSSVRGTTPATVSVLTTPAVSIITPRPQTGSSSVDPALTEVLHVSVVDLNINSVQGARSLTLPLKSVTRDQTSTLTQSTGSHSQTEDQSRRRMMCRQLIANTQTISGYQQRVKTWH